VLIKSFNSNSRAELDSSTHSVLVFVACNELHQFLLGRLGDAMQIFDSRIFCAESFGGLLVEHVVEQDDFGLHLIQFIADLLLVIG
jgi:hypothetical protein